MARLLIAAAAAALLLSSSISTVRASPCLAMDINFNLFVFGLGGKDYNAGTQDVWTSTTPATDITTSNRPPFDAPNTVCYLSQFLNVIYALSADSKNPSSVYVYDVAGKSWSVVPTVLPSGSGPAFDPSNFNAILDHDTNVFYGLSNGEMFFLDMGTSKVANSTGLPWTDVGKPSFDTTNYRPVMALAQNHIHFLDVPGLSAGQADIFVIHFSFFQPTPQAYPINGGGNFPQQHGQATSFFQSTGVQQEFAYIPDDGSATYVINVETNTTQSLAGPITKDPQAIYFAGITSLVQLDSTGHVMFLPYQQNDTVGNSKAAWTKVSVVTPPAGSTATASGLTPTKTGSQTTGSAPSSTATANSNQGSSNDASMGKRVTLGLVTAVGMAVAAILL